uniref:Xyloglucan-specific endo-beta-1,4-glucanase 1 (GH12 protein XEG1)) n=1 Tax=Ganoderma boninense TaxID=34458 RepID=A0A5K1JZE1_9APHY|nr:Xyloglucan-specific endo-beta-1,4-glucanase 1 (EC (Glycoside hydrolase family 12 protein XEG1) (GH12 protein XEG1) [Ganoderma boninense]
MTEKEQDKDEAESEGEEHDDDDDDNDSDEDQDEEDEEEDEDEDEDEDDYEYELECAMPWYRDDDATPVFWVTDPPIVRSGNGFQKTIQTYGNEPTLDVVYWRIWIFARVGPVAQRETAQARASEE